MQEKLLESLGELRAAIIADPRVKKLDELEAQLMKDPRVIALAKTKDLCEDDYNLCLKCHPEDAPESRRMQKALFEAKLALDSDPLVKQYNRAYLAVRDLYSQIDSIIFGDFRKTVVCEAKK